MGNRQSKAQVTPEFVENLKVVYTDSEGVERSYFEGDFIPQPDMEVLNLETDEDNQLFLDNIETTQEAIKFLWNEDASIKGIITSTSNRQTEDEYLESLRESFPGNDEASRANKGVAYPGGYGTL